MFEDVPVTVDFRRAEHARAWTESAMSLRPWRNDFFERFVQEIGQWGAERPVRVLELGSGPGFLAQRLLAAHGNLSYVALDFSATMHELAQQRLDELASRVQFVERNLRDADWNAGLGEFDVVLTHQAVHELRHKRHAQPLHAQVREVLKPDGMYLVCDHFYGEGGMTNDQLYMTVEEQRQALSDAGFADVTELLRKSGLVLHRAVPAA